MGNGNDHKSDLVLVKLGGSLITDKTKAETARGEIIERLARELASALPAMTERVILGHGSGSFGHHAAARTGLAAGIQDPAQLAGVAETQASAARLHARVFEALRRAGARPFSIAPSSALVTRLARPARLAVDSLLLALEQGLLPVVYGDVVMDVEQGAAIASTETILLALADRLPRRGYPITRALWAGETAGVYGADGEPLPRLDEAEVRRLADHLEGAAGTDVTGGIRHRVETALILARRGIPSLIFDGRTEGALARALLGEPVPGTEVVG